MLYLNTFMDILRQKSSLYAIFEVLNKDIETC